jgi:hypothetical protein
MAGGRRRIPPAGLTRARVRTLCNLRTVNERNSLASSTGQQPTIVASSAGTSMLITNKYKQSIVNSPHSSFVTCATLKLLFLESLGNDHD